MVYVCKLQECQGKRNINILNEMVASTVLLGLWVAEFLDSKPIYRSRSVLQK